MVFQGYSSKLILVGVIGMSALQQTDDNLVAFLEVYKPKLLEGLRKTTRGKSFDGFIHLRLEDWELLNFYDCWDELRTRTDYLRGESRLTEAAIATFRV